MCLKYVEHRVLVVSAYASKTGCPELDSRPARESVLA